MDTLFEKYPDFFDARIHRGEEDLESLRQSNSPFVAVREKDHFVTFYVSREKVLSGEIDPFNMSVEELLEHAGVW